MMAHEEAARHYDSPSRWRACRLDPAPQLHDLMVKLVEARQRAGDLRGAREAGRRALTVAKETSDPMLIAAAALAFAGRLPGFGAIVSDAEVVGELEQALGAPPEHGDGAPRAGDGGLSEELASSPGAGAERALGQQAIELARSVGDPYVLAAVLRTTQWSVWTPDAIERRRQLATEILELAQRTGDRVLALDGEILRLWSALEHGDTDVAWRQLDLCTRLAGELRLPHYVWITAVARTGLHIATGSLDEAEQLTEHAFNAGHVATIPRSPSSWLPNASMCTRCGDRWKTCGRAAQYGYGLSVAECGPRVHAHLDVCAHRSVRSRPSRAHRDGRERFCAGDADAGLAHEHDGAGCGLHRGRRPRHRPRALSPSGTVHPLQCRPSPTPGAGSGGPLSWNLAVILGDESLARRHFEEALALEHRTGSRQYLALTQITYGQFLLRSGARATTSAGRD